MSSLVLTINHPIIGVPNFDPYPYVYSSKKDGDTTNLSNLSSWLPNLTHPGDVFGNTVATSCSEQVAFFMGQKML